MKPLTKKEVELFSDIINGYSVYITDDHMMEMIEDNERELGVTDEQSDALVNKCIKALMSMVE